MILKIPVYVEVDKPMNPADIPTYVSALNVTISEFFIPKGKRKTFNLKQSQLEMQALEAELDLHSAKVISYFAATEYLRTGKK